MGFFSLTLHKQEADQTLMSHKIDLFIWMLCSATADLKKAFPSEKSFSNLDSSAGLVLKYFPPLW